VTRGKDVDRATRRAGA